MAESSPVAKDSPLWIAWNAYKSTEEYANTRRWTAHEEHRDGSLWAAFEAGFSARAPLSMEGTIAERDYLCELCGREAIGHDEPYFPCKRTEADVLRASLSSSRRALEEARTEATRWRELLELTVAARDAADARVKPASARSPSDQGER